MPQLKANRYAPAHDEDEESGVTIDLEDESEHEHSSEEDDEDEDDVDLSDEDDEDDPLHEEDFAKLDDWEVIGSHPLDRGGKPIAPFDSASRSNLPTGGPSSRRGPHRSQLPPPSARRAPTSRNFYKVPEAPSGPPRRRNNGKIPTRSKSEIDEPMDHDDYPYPDSRRNSYHPSAGWGHMPYQQGHGTRSALTTGDPFDHYADHTPNPFMMPGDNYGARQRGNRISMPPGYSGQELMASGGAHGYSPYHPYAMSPYGYAPPGYPPNYFPPPPHHHTPSLPTSKKGTPAPAEDAKPKTPVQDPGLKLIQQMLHDQRQREEDRLKAEAARIADMKNAEAAAKLKKEEDKLTALQALILQHNKEQIEREKRQDEQRKKEAAEKAAAEQLAADEKKRADEKAKEVKAAAEKAKLEAENEAAKKAAEEKEKHEKALEEAKKKQDELEKAKKKFEDEAKALRPTDDMLKPPIKFKDAVGRKFSFPWHLCKNWKGMQQLIHQAFLHVDVIGQHVHEGHYDLIGPDGEIILPQVWETMVKPDMSISMHMWPIAEPRGRGPPPGAGGPGGPASAADNARARIDELLAANPAFAKKHAKLAAKKGGPPAGKGGIPPPPPGGTFSQLIGNPFAAHGDGPRPPPPMLPAGAAGMMPAGIADVTKKKGSSSKDGGKKKSSSSSKNMLMWMAGNPRGSSSKSGKKKAAGS